MKEQRAVNAAMTEFGTGADGARLLLERVLDGSRPKPESISDQTLQIYREFVQRKYEELQKLRPEKNIDVMRFRLEIYRIWLGN